MCYQSLLIVFFNDTATTEIYTLSLHDALPILTARAPPGTSAARTATSRRRRCARRDRKSTRLNSSHSQISYAVFCLEKRIDRLEHALLAGERIGECQVHCVISI